jgi:CubicO group peptidase (beta-lactamase class C family)
MGAALVLLFGSVELACAASTDASGKTVQGVTYSLPEAWGARKAPSLETFDAPEGDAHVAVVDVNKATDAKTAAATAWHLYRAAAQWPLKLVTEQPARDGWDEEDVVSYETSPDQHVHVEATALRKGTAWTVFIVEGSQSTVEKRFAAILSVMHSLRPAGYIRESFAGRVAHALDSKRVGELRAFVQTSIGQLGVPGAAIALVDHGRLVYEGGVGVRELGKPEAVDAHTLFMIASNTKGMSTLLLSELVDEGKLDWNEPVTRVYPSFRLGSDATTREVLVKHLVCACTGLPRKDYEMIFNTDPAIPAANTFTLLASTQPTSGFGEVYQYNNLMAAAAGYIGGHIVHPDRELGAAYDLAMQEKVFGPLGMTETTFSMSKALAGNHASPHGDDVNGRPSVAQIDPNSIFVPYRPAGGAWSSAHDMIKYVQNEITQGVLPDGRRLVSAVNLLARRARNVPTGEDSWYGMGLQEDAEWGVSVIHHGGSLLGYKSDILLVPDAQVGAVILTNANDGNLLLQPFMRRLLEILYDGRLQAADDVASAARRNQAQIAKARERLAVPAASADSKALAASYTNPDLGTLEVRRDGAATRFYFRVWNSQVASRRNDDGTTSFITIDPAVSGYEFVVGVQDGKRALTARDWQHQYVFTEKGP